MGGIRPQLGFYQIDIVAVLATGQVHARTDTRPSYQIGARSRASLSGITGMDLRIPNERNAGLR